MFRNHDKRAHGLFSLWLLYKISFCISGTRHQKRKTCKYRSVYIKLSFRLSFGCYFALFSGFIHLILVNRCSCNRGSLQFSASQVFLVAAFSSEHWVPTTSKAMKIICDCLKPFIKLIKWKLKDERTSVTPYRNLRTESPVRKIARFLRKIVVMAGLHRHRSVGRTRQCSCVKNIVACSWICFSLIRHENQSKQNHSPLIHLRLRESKSSVVMLTPKLTKLNYFQQLYKKMRLGK